MYKYWCMYRSILLRWIKTHAIYQMYEMNTWYYVARKNDPGFLWNCHSLLTRIISFAIL